MTAYLGLGSNLGIRETQLATSWKLIAERIGRVLQSSAIYETAAWGVTDQPDFLNQVIRVDTPLSPQQLLDKLLQIETDMGRQRLQKWGPRTIDLDILFYEDRIVESSALHLPHPQLDRRAFVLIPMADLAPNFRHPVLQRTIRELVDTLPEWERQQVRPFVPGTYSAKDSF